MFVWLRLFVFVVAWLGEDQTGPHLDPPPEYMGRRKRRVRGIPGFIYIFRGLDGPSVGDKITHRMVHFLGADAL